MDNIKSLEQFIQDLTKYIEENKNIDINNLRSYIDFVVEKAYSDGYNQGFNEGFDEGIDEMVDSDYVTEDDEDDCDSN